jgi:hypothetical protein
VPTGTSGASGGAESHSSESSHGAPRSSRATRKSRTPRNSDTRSSPSGNLFDALSHDDASVSSASSQDQHEPMFSVGSCVFPAESIYYNGVFQRRLHENGPLRVSIQSDAFAEFIPFAGNKLIPEAAGLQHYLPPTVALTEFSLISVQEATLTPLCTCHSFDHAIFDSIELPESGLKLRLLFRLATFSMIKFENFLLVKLKDLKQLTIEPKKQNLEACIALQFLAQKKIINVHVAVIAK